MKDKVIKEFVNVYGNEPDVITRAPGRLEILGNHTDYNEGLVLSAAVNLSTWVGLKKRKGSICRLYSVNQKLSAEFDIKDKVIKPESNWTSYIKGMLMELKKRGCNISAFDGIILSNLPLSAGMSSSAALEIASGLAFTRLFDFEIDKKELAKIGQITENEYVGVKTGLLDQFSSVFGKKDSFILCDFRDVAVKRIIPVPQGYVIVVVNSMKKHDLVDSEYNIRFENCRNALTSLKHKYPDIKALRDVSPEMLEKVKAFIDSQDYMRAKHVVTENDRVLRAVKTLEESNMNTFGKLLYESHESSKEYFENSCPELDYLIELAKTHKECVGARLSGGGFGGISIHIVAKDKAVSYCDRISTAFKLQTQMTPQTLICSIGDGAEIL